MDRGTAPDQWYVHVRGARELPLRESPLRFGVVMGDGSTSNGWRVWVENEGDVYICCRDNMSDLKVSLHRSGQQHIAHTSQSGQKTGPGTRFLNQWPEPSQDGPVLPSFKLLFPSWGVRLDEADRSKTRTIRRKWADNQVLIEHDGRLMVAVDFILRDEDFLLNGREHPIGTLAVLPAPVAGRSNRRLFVVVSKGPDERFREIARKAFSRISAAVAEQVAHLRQDGEVPVACMTGYGDERASHGYMIVVPVHVCP